MDSRKQNLSWKKCILWDISGIDLKNNFSLQQLELNIYVCTKKNITVTFNGQTLMMKTSDGYPLIYWRKTSRSMVPWNISQICTTRKLESVICRQGSEMIWCWRLSREFQLLGCSICHRASGEGRIWTANAKGNKETSLILWPPDTFHSTGDRKLALIYC